MARQLRLYSGINPNTENGIHYFFNTASRFINELQSHLVATIPLNNYRINLNTAKISLGGDLTMNNFEKVTYIIDYDDVTNYFKCYYVDSILLQDYVVYNLSVDLWATYILNATFSNIHVTRCNRAIEDKGIYDDVPATYERQEEFCNFVYDTDESEGFIRDTKVWIVYLVEYNVEQSAIFGDQHISATGLFASRLSDIRNGQLISPIEKATDAVGGIYKIQNGMDARVIQAWIVPQWLVNCGGITGDGGPQSRYAIFQSKGREGNYTFEGYIVFPAVKSMDLIGNKFELNYDTYIGTRNNCLKSKRYVDKYMNELTLYSFMGTNSLKIVMIQGDNQKDLTKDFEVTLTTNNGEVTGIRAVAGVIGNTLVSTLGVVGAMKKENYYDVAKQVAGSATKQIDAKPSISSAVGNGDASNLYWMPLFSWSTEADARKLRFPIIKERFKSTRDEELHARMEGANFDKYISGFDFPLTKSLLGTGQAITFDKTYIVASCNIEGVPNDARNIIESKLNAGIYYEILND